MQLSFVSRVVSQSSSSPTGTGISVFLGLSSGDRRGSGACRRFGSLAQRPAAIRQCFCQQCNDPRPAGMFHKARINRREKTRELFGFNRKTAGSRLASLRSAGINRSDRCVAAHQPAGSFGAPPERPTTNSGNRFGASSATNRAKPCSSWPSRGIRQSTATCICGVATFSQRHR